MRLIDSGHEAGLPDRAGEVLEFWFGAQPAAEQVDERQLDMWFRNGARYDTVVSERFGALLDPAAAGACDHWCATPRGRLALLVLLDQMPRHVHRGTARAFVADARAREVCLAGLKLEHDLALTPIERSVFYLPLEHAEDLALQERSVALYRRLADAVSEAARPAFLDNLDYAVRHRDIIARFGHFPHRSPLIGRQLSAAEAAFLEQPGSSF